MAAQALVQEFQDAPAISVLLLTTQVGGLGLTLTAATRVIIVGGPQPPVASNDAIPTTQIRTQSRWLHADARSPRRGILSCYAVLANAV